MIQTPLQFPRVPSIKLKAQLLHETRRRTHIAFADQQIEASRFDHSMTFADGRFDAKSLYMLVVGPGGVKSIVKFGSYPQALADVEIDSVRTLVAPGFPMRQSPFLRAGQKFRVSMGPCVGQRAQSCRRKTSG